jgi:hypothetical protein
MHEGPGECDVTEREMIINARPCVRTEIGQIERLISSEIRPHYLQVYEAEANKLRATLDAMNSYLGLDNETVI